MAFHRSHVNHKSDGWLADLQAESNVSPFAAYTPGAESNGNQATAAGRSGEPRAELIRRSTLASTTMPAISPYGHWHAAPMPADRDFSNAVRCPGSAATLHPVAGCCIFVFGLFRSGLHALPPDFAHDESNAPRSWQVCSLQQLPRLSQPLLFPFSSPFPSRPHLLFANPICPGLSTYVYLFPLSATIINCHAQSHRSLPLCYLLCNASL